jgi:four helix bundle protein
VQRYTDLKVWQRAHQLVLRVYQLTTSFPADERFGLTAQLRRAVASVSSNIAEGCRRSGAGDFARFLNIAEGSLAEADYQLLLSRDLAYVTQAELEPLRAELDEVAAMLHALRRKVEGEAN